ncbi:MAG: DMT family transporter [Candidatus Peribacteria bacterium]|jgi:drug/metabolite transporter (DMT)-like permease|nr:DMT family transporter [Candidatus Peribacteria bacterium]
MDLKQKLGNKYLLGSVLVLLAACFWGATPIIAKLTYSMGSNPVNAAFLRNFLALPIIFIILACKKISLKLSGRELVILVVLGVFNAFTTILLYMSYNYVSVGVATTLNCSFPVLVMIGSIVFLKQKASKRGTIALAITMAGIVMFFSITDNQSNPILGTGIAFLSAICYAAYVLIFEKSKLKDYAFKLTFYICVINSICCFVFGLVHNQITFALTPEAWIYSTVIALLCSVLCITFFNLGIKYVGSVTSSILVMAEPVIAIILGSICLGEEMTAGKIVGCVLIIMGIFVVQTTKNTP